MNYDLQNQAPNQTAKQRNQTQQQAGALCTGSKLHANSQKSVFRMKQVLNHGGWNTSKDIGNQLQVSDKKSFES